MKVVKRGNVYKKAGWLKEHEEELLMIGCTFLVYFLLVFTIVII